MKQPVCKLSVVLAIFNESANLARCLDSVKEIADEIVIVDGNSTDDSIKIAKRYTKNILSTTNKANFHINKQQAIDTATGELILQLDADEVVSMELTEFILAIKHNPVQFNHIAAWWIPRKNYFLNHWLKKGGQYPDPVIRLFWAGKAKLPQEDVHEQMVVTGKIGWADGYLDHFSNPSLSDYFRKMNTYTSLKATQLADKKVSLSFYHIALFFCYYPLKTFFSLVVRHKGFLDGWPGILFSLLSSLHFPLQYLKLWELYEKEKLRYDNSA